MLCEEDLRQFDQQGFVSAVPVMSAEEATRYCHKLEQFERKQGGSRKAFASQ